MLCLYLRDDVIYLAAQLVDFGDGGADVGVELRDVDDFAGVLGGDVAADGEVVVVRLDGVVGDVLCAVRDVGLVGKGFEDFGDVVFGEGVVVGFFFVEFAGVDELGAGVAFVAGEDEDIDGDGGAVEEVGREGDDGFDVVVVHQVFADFLLGTAPVEDAGEGDDGGAAFGGEPRQRVHDEGKVGFGFGGKDAGGGVAFVVDQGGVVVADPAHGVGRVGTMASKGRLSLSSGLSSVSPSSMWNLS